MKVKALSARAWSHAPSVESCAHKRKHTGVEKDPNTQQSKYILPPELQAQWQQFQEFYKSQYSGRNVQLVPHLVLAFSEKKSL